MLRSITFMVCLLGLAGCPDDGGVSPRKACEDTSAALCERIYTCLTPEELAAKSFPASESACITNLEASEGCSAKTTQNACTGNEKYHPSEAATCSDQVTGLTCGQLRDPLFSVNVDAPACAKVCSI